MKTKNGEITKRRLIQRLRECKNDPDAFLAKYARGRNSRTHWLRFEGALLPAKAVFAASHDPFVFPRTFNTSDCYGYSSHFGIPLFIGDQDDKTSPSSAVLDLQEKLENQDPEYKKRMSGYYVRVTKIRNGVLARANGFCENCGRRGFLKKDGTRYLETHHIISLSEQGPDTMENVIALCADDHREAHSGKRWKALQSDLKSKILLKQTGN